VLRNSKKEREGEKGRGPDLRWSDGEGPRGTYDPKEKLSEGGLVRMQ